ncbi:porin, partial [Escherichia coli]|nr:porin [Escherichia coli]MDZ9139599.1 porin [Escherichia coli]
MKLKIVAVVVTGLLAANVAHAAEVYNKDGNKLDLYGKVTALRYFTDDKRDDGDKTYARLGFKGETQINDQMIGFGHWEYDFKGYNDEANGSRGGFAPIFPDTCYHLTHYWPAAADIPVASD